MEKQSLGLGDRMKRIIGLRQNKKNPGPTINEIIASVDEKADSIDTKINKCDADLRKILAQLKTMTNGPGKDNLKEKAHRLIQRKRQYEGMSNTLRDQSFTMDQVTNSVQIAMTNQDVVRSLHFGVSELKNNFKNISLQEIEDLQDTMLDIQDVSEDVNAALTGNFAVPDIDDDELNSQLEALGRDFILDNDSSYLDCATSGPSSSKGSNRAPTSTDPNADQKVLVTEDGVQVDEFGLPILPNVQGGDPKPPK